MAILILAFHAAPVHKKIFGAIDYKYKPPFGLGLDHQWLGFFQYTTGEIFARYGAGTRDPFGEYGRSGNQRIPVQVFDPRGDGGCSITRRPGPTVTAPILGEEGGGEAARGSGPAGAAAAAPAARAAGPRPAAVRRP